MAQNSKNLFVPASYSVWTAPFGTVAPTTPTATPSAAWYEVGLLSDAGITEARSVNETQIYDLVGRLLRTARNQEQRPFTFEAVEDNRVVRELRYPQSTFATTTATQEVQTVTISGVPTGGTFNLSLLGYGTASGLVYNITTTALATALNTAFSMSGITVSGTAGTTYTVTFPALVGNVPTMTASSALTGGTTPSVAVAPTTEGVPAVNTRQVGSGTGQNLRGFLIYLSDGPKHKLFVINNGEAVHTGTLSYSGSAASIAQFTLQPYADSSGNFFSVIDDDPAQSVSFA